MSKEITMSDPSKEKVYIFVSYKHDDDQETLLSQDEEILNQLMEYIYYEVLDAGGEFWFDQKIKWGNFWDDDIRKNVEKADIAIMLISQRYLSSKYIREVEIEGFVNRRKEEGLLILPLILSPCLWEKREWLANTQFFPLRGKTVEDYSSIDRKHLYKMILDALLKHIETIQSKKKKP